MPPADQPETPVVSSSSTSGPAPVPEAKPVPTWMTVVFTLASVAVTVLVIGGMALMTGDRLTRESETDDAGPKAGPMGRGPAPKAFPNPDGTKAVPTELSGGLTFFEVPRPWAITGEFYRLQALRQGWKVVEESAPKDGVPGLTLVVAKSGWARYITVRERPGGQACTVSIVDQ
jgi:hypothetical protein